MQKPGKDKIVVFKNPTPTQKEVVKILFNGGHMNNMGRYGVRVLDAGFNPVLTVKAKTLWALRDITKMNKKRGIVLDIAAIRKLHGKSWVKKEYKRLFKARKAAQLLTKKTEV